MTRLLAGIVVLLLLSECRKSTVPEEEPAASADVPLTRGFPPDRTQVDAYLYSSQRNYLDSLYQIVVYAAFSDKKKNLWMGWNHIMNNYNNSVSGYLGTVNTGRVTYNNLQLQMNSPGQAPACFYNYTLNGVLFQPETKWLNDGYIKFKRLDVNLTGNSPKLNTGLLLSQYQIAHGEGITLPNPAYNVNADSCYMVIRGYSYGLPVYYKKLISPTDTLLQVNHRDISRLNSDWLTISFYCHNYFYQVLNDKTYLFELATISERGLYIVQ